MRAARSPSTGRPYPLTMICQVWRVARSSVYATAASVGAAPVPGKRGPKTLVSDPDLVAAIRGVLARRRSTAKATGRCARGWPTGAWSSAASASCG